MDEQIACYQNRLHLEAAHFTKIEHEDAFVAIVYKVVLPTGKELILKICPRPYDHLREEYFLKKMIGVVPVPKVIQLLPEEGKLNGAVLMECVPGRPLETADITEEIAYEMGRLLAHIHLQRVLGYGNLLDKSHLNITPETHFVAKFEEGLQECALQLPISLIKQLRNYMEEHLFLLKSVDGPCVVHRDFRPGNIIIHKGKIAGVIDWAGARGSFAEEDFCSLEHGEWGITTDRKLIVLEGYKSVRPLPEYARIMPLLRLNRVVAMTGFMVRDGLWQKQRTTYERNLQFLEKMSVMKLF